MTKQKRATVTQLHAELNAHDAAAIALMRETQRHLRVALDIERELQRLEWTQKRAKASRLALA